MTDNGDQLARLLLDADGAAMLIDAFVKRLAPPGFLLGAPEVANLLCISETMVRSMDKSGELGPAPIRLRGRLLWSRFELENWVKAECPRRERWVAMKEQGHATV
jgi:hypothetical protein